MMIENDFCERLEYIPNILVNNKFEALEHVKKHKNVFATKIIRRSHIYDDFIVISETSYYDDDEKERWLWVFGNEGLFVVEKPFYKISIIIEKIKECNFRYLEIEHKYRKS